MLKVKEDKELLVKLLERSLKWSESSLMSFRKAELNEIYSHVLNRKLICKAKTYAKDHYEVTMRIPVRIREELDLTYGDRFGITVNVHSKKVILTKKKDGRLKLRKDGQLSLPFRLAEKKLLKENDDTMLLVEGDRIILKSFSFMQ